MSRLLAAIHRFAPLALAVALLAPPAVTAAQAPDSTPARPAPAATPSTTPAAAGTSTPVKPVEPRVVAIDRATASMGDRVRLTVEGLDEFLQQKKRPVRDLVLYLDGRALKEARAEPVNPGGDILEFRLLRVQASREAWNAVLAEPGINGRRVTVSTGFPDEREFQPAPTPLRLDLLDRFWLWVVAAFLLVVLGTMAYFSDILRDPAPAGKLAEGVRRPYSLARTQMAFWFSVVLASYLFLLIVTRDHETLNAPTLVLLGIGAATLASAAGVDASKRERVREEAAEAQSNAAEQATYVDELEADRRQLERSADAGTAAPEDAATLPVLEARLRGERRVRAELDQKAAALASQRWPTSEWFLRDLLTDVNGVNLHRFQMLVWTLVLGGVFLYRVYTEVTMPAFSATLLALVGISSGVYVALKVPEKQTLPAAPADAPPPAPAEGAPAAAAPARARFIPMGFSRLRPQPPGAQVRRNGL